MTEQQLVWHRVLDAKDLPEGRVATVEAGGRAIAVTHFKGEFAAFDNRCPHQGGPLGEGSIERGWLRCPWYGYDYDPLTGEPPAGFADCAIAVAIELREDALFVGLPAAEPHVDTVSDVMVQTMVNWGVNHVFGIVGHSNLGLADAFRRQEEAGALTYIGVRHEGAAAFAASAFAKLTGRPAACFGIAGPGATNLLTGLWDAKMDRAPVLALTGQIDTQVVGPGMFQEVDLAAAFGSVSRWSQTVLPDSRHAELMSLALKHATMERDVTHLIFPNDVQTLPAGDESPGSPAGRVPNLDVRAPAEVIERATALIEQAKRPMIIAGYGARFHIPQLTALAERLGAPIVTTFKAKGLVADSHELAAGVLGRSGTPVASWLMNEADLLIVLGASFSDHTGIAEYKPTIQVDFDAMAIGKSHPVTVPVLAGVGAACEQIEAALGAIAAVDQRADIAERWQIWRAEKARRAEDDRGAGVNAASIFAALTRHAAKNAVIAVDVGNNTYSFGRYFESSGDQSVLMSGYLGSIGFGYPAAMGAWAAAPDRPTIAVKYGMKITHILLNDGELGKISKEQRASQFPVWQTSLHNPDFSRYAENCGALGIRVTERADLDAALERAFAHDGPALVEVITDSDLL